MARVDNGRVGLRDWCWITSDGITLAYHFCRDPGTGCISLVYNGSGRTRNSSIPWSTAMLRDLRAGSTIYYWARVISAIRASRVMLDAIARCQLSGQLFHGGGQGL
jgi:hypothetical protein